MIKGPIPSVLPGAERVLRSCILGVSLLGVCPPVPAFAQPADPAPPVVPGVGALVREIPRDLRRFLSWDTAQVLVVGGDLALIAHAWDDEFATEIATTPELNNAFEAGHTYGAFAVQALVGIALYAGGRMADRPKLAIAGADVMRAQLLSQAYVQALKFTVRRERHNGSNQVSFPSGHSASAFATAGVLQRHYGWKVGIPATILAGYVAAARVHDNYLSDVVFGAAMGVAGERTITLRGGRYRISVEPTTTSRGWRVSVDVTPR